ncbi:MAG: hypothetical protein M3442_15140, partial [Chloroflexota bacterium]|nr:hypothetical protein [Chloroflexota bacterium]
MAKASDIRPSVNGGLNGTAHSRAGARAGTDTASAGSLHPATRPPPVSTPVSTNDRAAERALRTDVRQEVSRLLDEQHLFRPRPEDEARIRTLIRDRVSYYQRNAAVTNTPLIHDQQGMERRLFDGLLRLGPLQPLMDDASVEEII